MLGQNASIYKCDRIVIGVTFLLVSQYESPRWWQWVVETWFSSNEIRCFRWQSGE